MNLNKENMRKLRELILFTIIILIAFFGGMIMLALGVIAEYIWRIYEEVKGRPGYIIRSKDGDDEK